MYRGFNKEVNTSTPLSQEHECIRRLKIQHTSRLHINTVKYEKKKYKTVKILCAQLNNGNRGTEIIKTL